MSVDWKPHLRLRGRARPVVGTEQQERWVSRVLGRRQKQLIEIIRRVIRQTVARSKVSGNNQDCVDTHGWLDPCPSCREWVLLLTGALIPARPSAACDAQEAGCANGQGCPEYDHSSCHAPRDGTRMQDPAKTARHVRWSKVADCIDFLMSMLETGAEAPLGRWSMTRPLLRDLFWKYWRTAGAHRIALPRSEVRTGRSQGQGWHKAQGTRHNQTLPSQAACQTSSLEQPQNNENPRHVASMNIARASTAACISESPVSSESWPPRILSLSNIN